MKPQVFAATALATIFAAFAATAGAQGTSTESGEATFVTGGVTAEELRDLANEKDRYDLWVTTAAKDSGAFLSDVEVRIEDTNRNVVVDTKMEGPWLFADLPQGTYVIEAKFNGQVKKSRTRIGSGGQRQVIMYFDSPATLSPEWETPFDESPYADAKR